MAVSHRKVATVLSKQGNDARALDEFRQAREITREIIGQLKEQSPGNAELLSAQGLNVPSWHDSEVPPGLWQAVRERAYEFTP